MARRNNAMIRRDIKRLVALIEEKGSETPALAAVSGDVKEAASRIDIAWKVFQALSVKGDKDRAERDDAMDSLLSWIQQWRPVILVKIPGADMNLKTLPPKGATPDETVTVAEDMIDFMKSATVSAAFIAGAEADLGTRLEIAKALINAASDTLFMEEGAEADFTEACQFANPILVKTLKIVRSAFGPTAREYKQFIARESSDDEEDSTADNADESASGQTEETGAAATAK